MKPTRTMEECLNGLPAPIAEGLKAGEESPFLSARRLQASYWVKNPHAGEDGEFTNILFHPLADIKALTASWYLHRGGKDEKTHQSFLEQSNLRDSKYHGVYRFDGNAKIKAQQGATA